MALGWLDKVEVQVVELAVLVALDFRTLYHQWGGNSGPSCSRNDGSPLLLIEEHHCQTFVQKAEAADQTTEKKGLQLAVVQQGHNAVAAVVGGGLVELGSRDGSWQR